MRKKIHRVIIIVNLVKGETQRLLKEAESYFKEKVVQVTVVPVNKNFSPNLLPGTDLAITLGGDGTLLYCVRILAGEDIPILAVNLGDVGFITEISKAEWIEALEKYLSGRLSISRRMMFEAWVERGRERILSLRGLNDAVIRSSGLSKIIRLRVYLSKTYVARYRADGVIMATPTGATAYSMSAGGPILHPEMEAFILNPICPYTLSNRPIVVPGNEVLEIEIEEKQRADIILTIDGQDAFRLCPADRVVFKMSEKHSLLIQSDKRNFYEVLRAKLNWAGEPNA